MKVDRHDADFVIGLVAEFGEFHNKQRVSALGWQLVTLGRKLHAIDIRKSNEVMTGPTKERIERQEEKLEAAARLIADALGVSVEITGEPRGHALRLTLPSGRSNSMGGGEWCV